MKISGALVAIIIKSRPGRIVICGADIEMKPKYNLAWGVRRDSIGCEEYYTFEINGEITSGDEYITDLHNESSTKEPVFFLINLDCGGDMFISRIAIEMGTGKLNIYGVAYELSC